MKGFIRQLSVVMATIMVVTLVGCVGGRSQNDGFDVDSDLDVSSDTLAEADVPNDQAAKPSATAEDDFAEFDNAETTTAEAAPAESAPSNDDDLSLEDEITQANGDKPQDDQAQAQAPAAPEEDPFAEPAQTAEVPPPEAPIEPQELMDTDQKAQAENPPPPEMPAEPIAPVEPEAPAESAPTAPVAESPAPAPVEITGLRYQANDTGGTVVVQADGPLTYTTRTNPDLKQFIIEVENAHLPKKLTRSLNTKDIRGTIGTVDAYQNPGSNTARFVIQLRDGATEPAVQAEGNSLLIAASQSPESLAENGESGSNEEGDVPNVSASGSSEDKMLASQNLSEFMAGNTKFYGKKISIETSNMEVRDALKFITDETGVNMVISDEVRGALSLKLRQVPWDQALVMILKARKLGYTRQGSVLRIAPLADLKQEEDDAAKLAASRKGVEPLKVRMFPVNYAKVDDLEKKIKDFLSERGKAVGDVRTNSLVVTDLDDNLSRIAKLISSLDIQPPQVLIEGKIVEANEDFQRTVGVSWGATGQSVKIGNSSRGPVNMRPSLNVGQGEGATSAPLSFGLNVGTLDLFGSLTAALSLNERESNVKVLSSPRIVAMSNEKANITNTTEIPMTTITTTNGTTQQTIQFKPLTLKLEVTPQVTADSSVIMNVLVNRQFLGANVANANDTQLPVNSREAQTKVLVRNGQTAVIGGLYQSDATLGTHGVPWFKDLPIVGTLFKGSDNRKQKVELLIFLTPRILGQNETDPSSTTTKDF